jgi:endonuclease YncB( thermonuclease family)
MLPELASVLSALAVVVGGAPSWVAQARFEARCVAVAEGDTLTVVRGGLEQEVRLAGVDAPEPGQAWAAQARQRLLELANGKTVSVYPAGWTADGRLLARVEVAGEDLGMRLLLEGWAWTDEARSGGPASVYAQAQAAAADRGLWADLLPAPLPPWEFWAGCTPPTERAPEAAPTARAPTLAALAARVTLVRNRGDETVIEGLPAAPVAPAPAEPEPLPEPEEEEGHR